MTNLDMAMESSGEQIQELDAHLKSPVERAKRSVLQQIRLSDHGSYDLLHQGLVSVVSPGSTKKMLAVVGGLSGDGKSTFIGEEVNQVIDQVQPRGGPEYEVPIYTADMKNAIAIARLRGEVKASQGYITPDEYEAVGEVQNRIRWAFYQHMDAGALIEEVVFGSESFIDGQAFGVVRANIGSLRNIGMQDMNLFLAFFSSQPFFRFANINFREKMLQLGKDGDLTQILEAQKQVGIIEDRSPDKIQDIYDQTYVRTGNLATLSQQIDDTSAVIHALGQRGEIELDDEVRDLPLGNFQQYLFNYQDAFNRHLKIDLYPRLAESIVGVSNARLGLDTKVGYFENIPLVKENLRWEFRGLKEDRDIVKALTKKAQKTKNRSLIHDLAYFGIQI